VTLGQKLRAARLEQKLTQEQVGGRDFTKAYVSELERGIRKPRLTTLKILARRLRRPLSYFLDGVSEDGEPRALLSIGLAHLHAGSLEGAQASLERGLDVAAQHGDEILQARLELALATVDRRRGHLARARHRAERALRALGQAGDPGLLVGAHVCLGWIKLDAGDPASALWTLEAALRLAGRLPTDAVLLVDLHTALGEAYRRLGRTEEARGAFGLALQAGEPFQDHHHVAARYLELAAAAAENGAFDEAAEHADRAFGLYHAMAQRRRLAEVHERLGGADLAAGRWEEARHHYRWSIALHAAAADRQGTAQVLGSLAEAMLERVSPEAARAVGEAALGLLPEGTDPWERAHALRLRGTLCRFLGRPGEARSALLDSLRLFEDLHRVHEAHLVRRELALLAIDAQDLAEARRLVRTLDGAPADLFPAGGP
jgi:tetratricopeptide (TPR) repeat protein